jgi:streptomycin 6-kinase
LRLMGDRLWYLDRMRHAVPPLSAFASVVRNWHEWFPDRAEHAAADAHARLGRAAHEWRLESLAPMLGGLGFVCAAEQAGVPVVLKVNPDVGAATFESEGVGLEVWGRLGAAAPLLAVRDGGLTLLLRRLVPGTTLSSANLGTLPTLEVLGGIARQLHSVVGPIPGVRDLSETSLIREYRETLKGQPFAEELEGLLRSGERRVLLHWDLHGENVLRDEGTWRMIDPKPCFGDPHADCWALVAWDADAPLHEGGGRADLEHRIVTYAAAAGLDSDRVAAWTRLRAAATLGGLRKAAHLDPRGQAWATALERLVELLAS